MDLGDSADFHDTLEALGKVIRAKSQAVAADRFARWQAEVTTRGMRKLFDYVGGNPRTVPSAVFG